MANQRRSPRCSFVVTADVTDENSRTVIYGARGQRDRICIGNGVESAARAQEKSAGGEVSLTTRAYQLLDEHFQPQFNLDEKGNLYVASKFYSDRFERAAKAAAYGAGAAVTVRTASKTATVVRGGEAGGRQVVPSKSWSRTFPDSRFPD